MSTTQTIRKLAPVRAPNGERTATKTDDSAPSATANLLTVIVVYILFSLAGLAIAQIALS